MSQPIPSLSLRDNLLYNLYFAVPMVLQGAFTRSRFWVGFWTRWHRDPAAVKFVSGLRARYGRDLLYLRLSTRRALLVLDRDSVARVLDHSPTIYADGKMKRDGMRVFQPNAVTISRGDEWRDRRRFNEAVLDFGCPVHRYAAGFLQIIREDIAPATGPAPQLRCWEDFDGLFERLALQVIFGRSARHDTILTGLLRKMMREANRLLKPKRSSYFDPFYTRLGAYLYRAEPGSLVALCGAVPATEQTKVENQIPHWMFAAWETLAINTVRALALILAHPRVEQRVRQEIADTDPTSAAGIDRLDYLAGCLQEAMRLWPTTPVLLRETVTEDTLGGETVLPGTQVIVWNSFNHRDQTAYPLANTFAPEAWAAGRPSPLFNHLSSGPQLCAGIDLLLFLGKAVLAILLRTRRYALLGPPLEPNRPIPYAYNHFDIQFTSG
jgi:cytochrome P450